MSNNNRLADDLLLTGSAVATTEFRNSYDQHTAYITYSPDTNSTNALEVYFEMSPDDGTTWYQVGAYTNSSGTLTKQLHTISELSAGTTAQLLPPYTFEGNGTHIRASVSETNTPGDFGNVTIDLHSRSSC